MPHGGYEQTNIDFFQVTRIVGPHTVEVLEVSQIAADTGNEPSMTGKCLPKLDGFTGEPLRRRVNGRSKSVRIDRVRTAFLLRWPTAQMDRLRLSPLPP